MSFLSILGDGLRAIGDGLGALGNGIGSMFGGGPTVRYRQQGDSGLGNYTYTNTHKSYARIMGGKNIQDITVTENGVRQHVRVEDGKVVASTNVDDPDAFVKKYKEQADETFANMDKTFSDMSENMDKTFKDMDENFKKMFKDR